MIRGVLLTGALVMLCSPAIAQQQNPNQPGAPGQNPPQPQGPQVVDATIKSVEVKGRVRKLTVTSGTEDLTIVLTPKIQFEVVAEGDEGFIRAGQVFESQGVMTNKRLFVSDILIRTVPQGRKAPPGRYAKAPEKAGQSQNTYQIVGPIQDIQPDKDYPDYKAVLLKTVPPAGAVLLEKNFVVRVASDDIELVKEGMMVEVEGLPGPGGKFLVSRVSVQLPEPLKSEDVLGPIESAEKK